jgi:hypothetical protein
MFDSKNLMIDPSILVSRRADKGLQTGFNQFTSETDQTTVYVSSSFKTLVERSTSYNDDPSFSFFIGRLKPKNIVPYNELESLVDSYEEFHYDEVESSSYGINYEEIGEVFRERYPPTTRGKLSDILHEEFVFLAERSQIPSRTQKTPDTDIDGVRSFSLSEEELEELLDQAPGNYTEQLRFHKQKKGWNYINTMGGVDTLFNINDPLGQALVNVGLAPGLLAIQYDP